MPELPEVETVRKTLEKKLVGRKILSVEVIYPNIIENDIKEFKKNIQNQTIKAMKRRGKWLMFELDDYILLSHLRMEGKYFFKTKDDDYSKHEHVIFKLDNNQELRYNDTRKFGRMLLVKKEDLEKEKKYQELGLEPFDLNLTPEYLKEKFSKIKLPIKTALLDQSIIAGIGNIYANEILFKSKINPFKKACECTIDEYKKIIDNTKTILSEAIENGGTTIKSYESSEGVHGRFQQHLSVHGKENEPCPICKNLIQKEKVNGRGTYFCPICQNVSNS